MAVSYGGAGAWTENTGGAPTIPIPSHTSGDLLLLLLAAFADEAGSSLVTDGWTRISGADYQENLIWWGVWEKVGNGVQTNVAVTDATGGGAGICISLPGGDTGCTLVYNDDNTSDTNGVFTAFSGAGFRVGFCPIYGARTTTSPTAVLASGTATGTFAQRLFQTILTSYRLGIHTFVHTAAAAATYAQKWTGGNSTSNGIMVFVPEYVAPPSGLTYTVPAPADFTFEGIADPTASLSQEFDGPILDFSFSALPPTFYISEDRLYVAPLAVATFDALAPTFSIVQGGTFPAPTGVLTFDALAPTFKLGSKYAPPSPGILTFEALTPVVSINDLTTITFVVPGPGVLTFDALAPSAGGNLPAAAVPGTITDLEVKYLKLVSGKTGTFDDLYSYVYGVEPFVYFAALSGLSPSSKFSLHDHMMAYYRAQTGLPMTATLADLRMAFFRAQVGS